MTREIALHCMKSASELERELCEECPIYGQTGCDHCYEDALQYVIATLEQEPVLDKIRAEIKQYQSDYDVHGTEYDRTAWKAFNRCLQVIDKYKAGK